MYAFTVPLPSMSRCRPENFLKQNVSRLVYKNELSSFGIWGSRSQRLSENHVLQNARPYQFLSACAEINTWAKEKHKPESHIVDLRLLKHNMLLKYVTDTTCDKMLRWRKIR